MSQPATGTRRTVVHSWRRFVLLGGLAMSASAILLWTHQPAVGQSSSGPVVGTGDGLSGSYFDNRYLLGAPTIQRVDPQVDFDFISLISGGQTISNAAVIATNCLQLVGKTHPDEFSVAWSGQIQAQFSEPYTIHVDSDDGARVWLDGQLIVDDWLDGSRDRASAPINLVAGQMYAIQIQYYQNQYSCHAQLEWSSPSTPLEVVPQSQLYSASTNGGAPAESVYVDSIEVPTSGVTNEWFHGAVGVWAAGGASYSNGVVTATSSSFGIKDRADSFYYVFQPLNGNGQIVARLLGVNCASPTNGAARAAIMLRETLSHDSRDAMLSLGVTNNLSFQWRYRTAWVLDMIDEPVTQTAPCWMKIVRWGDWVGGFSSPDGTNWTVRGWEFLSSLKTNVFVGLAVSSQHAGSPCEAQFDQVSVGPADPAQVLHPVKGTGDGLRGDYYIQDCLYGPSVTNRVDPMINFNWAHQEPMGLQVGDPFGVCWTGEIQAQFTEPYTFELASKEQNWMRVWINEQLVVNSWNAWHPEGVGSGTTNLIAGQRYLIRVEFYNDHDQAVCRLLWSSPSTPQRRIPVYQLYSQPIDTDGNGMPDNWQMIYFGHLGVDPNADPDGDGLSNLQEYQYHTNPLKFDTAGDGISDAWKVEHCLDPWTNEATEQLFPDDLTILQMYQLGIDPNAVDTGGPDGLPFGLVYEYLGVNPTNLNGLVTVAAVANGSQATTNNMLGSWQVDGNGIYCLDRRGAVEFNLTVANPDKYVLKLNGTQNNPSSGSPNNLNLLISIDGESPGHRTLTAGYGTNGVIDIVTPFLKAGSHTVRVFWDDAASSSSLRIEQVRLLSVAGPDTNGSGIKDWVEKMVADESGLDLTNAVVSSYTSPACVEGRDPYLSMLGMTMVAGSTTNPVSVRHNAGLRWYADVPLSSQTNTDIRITYQNGGRTEGRRLKWLPTNVLNGSNLVIRVGDSLLLQAAPAAATNGVSQVTVATATQTIASYSSPSPSSLIPQLFGTAGVYTVSGTYQSGSRTRSGTLIVNVTGYPFPGSPACVMNYGRNWTLTNVPPGALFQPDPRMSVTQTNLPGGSCQMLVVTDENESRTVVARLGQPGPILDSVKAEGLRLFTTLDTYNNVITNYPDGSRLIETMEVLSPVSTNVTVRIDIIAGGVTFDDGTTTRILTATNFDALGQCRVRFIMPLQTQTANCHRISVWQGAEELAVY